MEATFCPSVWRTAIPVSSSSWAEDLPSCCWRPPGSMMVSHMSLRPDEQEEPGNLCLIMKRRSLVQARYIIYEAVYSACKKGDVIEKMSNIMPIHRFIYLDFHSSEGTYDTDFCCRTSIF